MKDPNTAAVLVKKNISNYELQWINIMNASMNNFFHSSSDSKADLIRIADKIKIYKDRYKTEYGFEYVKDFVRVAYKFQDAHVLYAAFKEFI